VEKANRVLTVCACLAARARLLAEMARVALICAFAASVSGNSVELTPDNFDKEVLQSGKAAFIKFLAPW
jgi:hypothetical protein